MTDRRQEEETSRISEYPKGRQVGIAPLLGTRTCAAVKKIHCRDPVCRSGPIDKVAMLEYCVCSVDPIGTRSLGLRGPGLGQKP